MKLENKFKELDSEFEGNSIFYHNVEECVKITEEFAVNFAKWIRTNAYDTGEKWYYQEDNETYTTEELLEIYKKQLE